MTTSVRAAMAAIALTTFPALGAAQVEPRPTRTFPQFAGTWVLDEAGSTGRPMPSVPRRMTITTSPDAITVTKVLQIPLPPPERLAYQYGTNTPPPEVYRFDGTPTLRTEWTYEHRYTFLLVSDTLALTVKSSRLGHPSFTQVTDAYSVDGDVLTVHRQLTSINPEGQILLMQEPTNNFRHTFVYRRSQ